MKLGITGHRPPSLGGYDIPNPTYTKIYNQLLEKIKEINPECIVSGMAQGTDQWAVKAAIELGIPFIAAVPCDDQDCMWPEDSRKEYQKLISLAKEVVIVSPGPYGYVEIKNKRVNKMHVRDQWIVDNSDALLAVWNGHRQSGTFATIRMAEKKIKKDERYTIHRIIP